jgi:hypothetical protein
MRHVLQGDLSVKAEGEHLAQTACSQSRQKLCKGVAGSMALLLWCPVQHADFWQQLVFAFKLRWEEMDCPLARLALLLDPRYKVVVAKDQLVLLRPVTQLSAVWSGLCAMQLAPL